MQTMLRTVFLLANIASFTQASSVTLKLMSFNTHHGLPTQTATITLAEERAILAENFPMQAAMIAAQKPDVVALQEVDNGTERANSQDQARRFSELTGLPAAYYAGFFQYQGGEYGMAMLSGREGLSSVLELPDGEREPRVALLLELDLEGIGSVVFVNVHFDWLDDSSWRLGQAEALLQNLDRDIPYVVMGDFQAERAENGLVADDGRTMRAFADAGFQCINKTAAQRFTYDALNPSREVDHICIRASSGVQVESVGLVMVLDEPQLSYHLPIVGTIAFHSGAVRCSALLSVVIGAALLFSVGFV